MDQINEVGKLLNKTKKNAESALRRYAPIYGRSERTRDIFDNEVPFEMEFETKQEEGVFRLSINFNKPPPVSNCNPPGKYTANCHDFTAEAVDGINLFNVGQSYFPYTVKVYADGELLDKSDYSEYSPAEGLVYVVNRTVGEVISICYMYIAWNYICNQDDPLEDTTNATGGLSEKDPPVNPGVSVSVDLDPDTQTPTVDYDSSIQADLYASIAHTGGVLSWQSHLGTLDNLYPGNANFGATGAIGFLERDGINANWLESETSFSALVRTGEHFGQFLDFFPSASEETLASFTVGLGNTVDIEVTMRHDYRGSIFPFLGPPRGPEGFFTVKNWGFSIAEDQSIIDNGLTQSPFYSLDFNQPFGVIVKISYEQRKITVQVGGTVVSFSGEEARFKFADGGNVSASANFTSWLTDPSDMRVEIHNVIVTPCRYQPGV